MKNEDHSFTVLAVLIVAGVIAACLPARTDNDKISSNDTTPTLSHSLTRVDTGPSSSAPKS